MLDEITYPFPNFNGCTVELWKWISNFTPHFTWHVITYPWLKMISVNLTRSIYVVAVQIRFETWISTCECPHKNGQYLKKFSNAYITGKFSDFLFVPRGSIDNKSVIVQHGAQQATIRCLKQRWPGLRPQRVNKWHISNKTIVIRSN